jgi:ATP-dependent RNA helicase RhlE
LRKIAKHIPVKRQTMLFSATMPKDIEEIAETYLRNPIRVQVAPPGKPIEKIVQGVHYIPNGDKARLLEDYLKKHPGEQALVFGRTKHGSEKLMKLLAVWGFKVGSIHGNKSQSQRDRTLTEFRSGALDVLVATDVAARGIDIPTVRHVYNFDLPNVPENYVHRIGRTARAGAEGTAVAFCSPAEMGELLAIEKILKKPIPVLAGAPWAADIIAATPKPGQNRGQRPAQGRGGQKAGAKPPAKPQSQRPGGAAAQGRPGGKPAGGGYAPRRSEGGGGKPRGPMRQPNS